MRREVVERIKEHYTRGLDELGVGYLNFVRNKEGKPPLPQISEENLDEVLSKMTNDELLHALEGQVCQDCR